MLKLNDVCVELPKNRISMQDVDAIEVEIWCGPAPKNKRAAVFMLSVNCQVVIEGFTTGNFTDAHTYEDDCFICENMGWVNDDYEADCYRMDIISMDAFEKAIAEIPELRMFSKNLEHCIESDHWMITTMRSEDF